MGKIAVVSTMGATGVTVSLGGSYLLGAFNSGNLDIPASLEKFRGDNGGSAVGSYFPGVLFSAEGDNWGSSKPDSTFLGSETSGARGRLVVNWEKFKCSSNESGKFTGRIRWLWTFVNGKGDKGLMLYASAKASSEASKLDAEGVIYSLDNTDGKWKIKHNKKSSDSSVKGIIGSDLDSKFPMVSDTFKNTSGLKVKEYWGFVDSTDTDKLTKLCKWESSYDSSNPKPESEFKGSWTWKHETGKNEKPFDWSKTSHSWLNTVYETLDPTLETLLNSFSAGTWTEEYFVHKELGVTVPQA